MKNNFLPDISTIGPTKKYKFKKTLGTGPQYFSTKAPSAYEAEKWLKLFCKGSYNIFTITK